MNLNSKDESQLNSKKEIGDSNKIVITETSIKESFKAKDYKSLISNKIKIIFIFTYFAIIIWVETLIRENLFLKSIPLQERIQKDGKYIKILDISKTISLFGVDILPSVIYVLVFLFMPLNYSFLILQVLVYSSYIANTMKMIYQSDRPNWKSELLIYSCNYGYGNPSGHSLTSISLYLSLSHILTNYFKISHMFNILIFMFFIIFSILIMVSRFLLAAHSMNQILYGFFLGLGLYYIMIYIIGYHKYQSINFLQHMKNKKVNLFYNVFHSALLVAAILVYIFIKEKDHSDLENSIFNDIRCKITKPFTKYKNNALFQSLSIISLIGAQIGINYLIKFLKSKNYIINASLIEWNKTKGIKKIILRILIILISSIGIIMLYFIPGSIPLSLVFIFKSFIPFFFIFFGIHFFGIFFCIYLKIANSEIYKIDILHEITSGA